MVKHTTTLRICHKKRLCPEKDKGIWLYLVCFNKNWYYDKTNMLGCIFLILYIESANERFDEVSKDPKISRIDIFGLSLMIGSIFNILGDFMVSFKYQDTNICQVDLVF